MIEDSESGWVYTRDIDCCKDQGGNICLLQTIKVREEQTDVVLAKHLDDV